jgi:hypothetical protein
MKAIKHVYEYFFTEPPVVLGDGTGVFIMKLRRAKDEAILRQAMTVARRMTNIVAKRKVWTELRKGRDIYEAPMSRAHQIFVDEEYIHLFRSRLYSEMSRIYDDRIKRNAKRRN